MASVVTLSDGTSITVDSRDAIDIAIGKNEPFALITDTAGTRWTVNVAHVVSIKDQ